MRRQNVPVVRILVFHDITPEAQQNFRQKLFYLKAATNVVSLDNFLLGELSLDRVNIVITFDDGYKSWSSFAGPLLKQLGLPATFFVSSGFLDLSADEEERFIRHNLATNERTSGGLSAGELQALAADGFSIGGHTRSHVNLGTMQDADRVRKEVLTDRLKLESLVGGQVKHFAYPFGAHQNSRVDLPTILADSGYVTASTTLPGCNLRSANPYLLFRDLTGTPMPLFVFRARVSGAYDGVMRLKSLRKRLARAP